jgi:hypothetical protein
VDEQSTNRRVWEMGDWDAFSELPRPFGNRLIADLVSPACLSVLDVGTGSGGNVAVPQH